MPSSLTIARNSSTLADQDLLHLALIQTSIAQRRGWWFQVIDESRRSDGYRDFSPRSQDDAIHKLRTLASATVGTGDWSQVEIKPGEQAALDAWGSWSHERSEIVNN